VKLESESSNCHRGCNFTWQSVFGFRKRQVLLQCIRLSVAKACERWALPTTLKTELRTFLSTPNPVYILNQAGGSTTSANSVLQEEILCVFNVFMPPCLCKKLDVAHEALG
jgi:hypothetical protein